MRIERLRMTTLPRVNKGSWLETARIASPMSWYPRYGDNRVSWMGLQDRLVVELTADDGMTGHAYCRAASAVAPIIESHLWRLVAGSDPRDHRVLYDQLTRATLPYGRGGVVASAVSVLDIALWDLAAKAYGVPLYQLIGGRVRDEIPIYLTTNDPHAAAAASCRGYKIAAPFGPADGAAGVQRNVELVARLRAAVGADKQIALDCFAGWTVPYTLEMLDHLRPYGIAWVEDPLLPEDLAGYRRIREVMEYTRLALGNFAFGTSALYELIDGGLVDMIQPDLTWMGGVTAGLDVLARARDAGVEFSPHNATEQPWALHLMAVAPVDSMAESVLRANTNLDGTDAMSSFSEWVRVPDSPGCGALNHTDFGGTEVVDLLSTS